MSDPSRGDPSPDTERTESVSRPVGTPRYEFLGEIAHGGMGTVFAAHDTALNRDVVVKVLHARFEVGTAPARRFVEEAKITGQLQHPGIPPVHDLGTLPDGRPFLAMKLIKGDTLDALLKARPDPTHDRGRFVAIFEQMCQALGYAHAHQVIHRDLKPANVMVGAFGEVQVMDWGLAKVLGERPRVSGPSEDDPELTAALSEIDSDRGDDSETRAGSVLGTPAYMPREQAIGAIDQIDQRSDVFGLGAILCAILTGKPPYVGADSESTRQLAALGKLDDAVTRLDACGAEPELVALCKRCLSVEKARRPADAGEVAGAVTALRAAADERARQAELDRVKGEEQRKRRRVQFTLAAAVLVMVAGGTVVAWWQDRQRIERRDRLARNADAVAASLDRCDEALRADDTATAALMLAQAENLVAEGGADHLADRLERCRADLALLRELDAIDVFRWTPLESRYPEPVKVAARIRVALDRFGLTPGETPPDEFARRVTDSAVRDRLVGVLDRWLWAERLDAVRAVLQAVDSDPFRDAIRDAAQAGDNARVAELGGRAEAQDQPDWFTAVIGSEKAVPVERRRALLAAALRRRPANLGLLMTMGGTYPLSQRDGAEERVRWYQAAVTAHPGNPSAHNNLGLTLWNKGDRDGAIVCYKEAIRLDPKYALAHNNLGNALRVKGDVDGAIVCYREVVRLNPKESAPHYALGSALRLKGDVDGAITCFREAIRLDPTIPVAHNDLGWVLYDGKRDVDGAITCFREAIRLNPKYALAHNNLGWALYDGKKDVDGAIVEFREAIRLNPKHPWPRNNLGLALESNRDFQGAIVEYREAIRLDPKNVNPHNGLAWLLAAGPDGVRDGKQAVEHATKACELTGWKEPNFIDTLAVAYAEAGDFDKAIEYQKKALSFPAFAKSSGPQARKQLALFEQKKPYRDPNLVPPKPRELAPPPREVKGR